MLVTLSSRDYWCDTGGVSVLLPLLLLCCVNAQLLGAAQWRDCLRLDRCHIRGYEWGAVLWRPGLQFLTTLTYICYSQYLVHYCDLQWQLQWHMFKEKMAFNPKIACFMGGDNTSPMSCHPHLGVLIHRNSVPEKFLLFLYCVYWRGEKRHRICRAPADDILRELIYESLMQFRMDYLWALTCGQCSSHSQLSIPPCHFCWKNSASVWVQVSESVQL